jgi:hypothetical protein
MSILILFSLYIHFQFNEGARAFETKFLNDLILISIFLDGERPAFFPFSSTRQNLSALRLSGSGATSVPGAADSIDDPILQSPNGTSHGLVCI